jgi:hypothetical protein
MTACEVDEEEEEEEDGGGRRRRTRRGGCVVQSGWGDVDDQEDKMGKLPLRISLARLMIFELELAGWVGG